MAMPVRNDPPESASHRYVRPPEPLFFPCEEEVPESRRHLDLRTALYQTIRDAFGDRAAVGSEQFVYWDPSDPGKRCAPDLMVRVGEADELFDSWKVWERGAPHLAVEVISPSDDSDRPWEAKLERYRHVGVRELVRFHHADPERPVRIWDAIEGDLVERDAAEPNFWRCDTLGAFWCVKLDPVLGRVLRLARDPGGDALYLTPAEARDRAEEAQREAEKRVRELEVQLAQRPK
jgi:Uma2 family endonuclease